MNERMEWAISYVIDSKTRMRNLTDVPVNVREEVKQKGFNHTYFSPSRPLDFWFSMGKGDMIVWENFCWTKDIMSFDIMTGAELVPFGNVTRAEVARLHYEQTYGSSDVYAFYKGDSMDMSVCVITHSAKEKGRWQASKFDNKGPYGDINRDTALECIQGMLEEGFRNVIGIDDVETWLEYMIPEWESPAK